MSKIIDLNLFPILSSLGFNEKEVAVYTTLLWKGEMSAISLSKLVELHRQFVYNALNSLKEKGLVVQIGEVRSRWRAQSPRKLIARAEDQQKLAERATEQLLLLQEEKEGQEFEVIEGARAFQSRSLQTIRRVPHGGVVRMICGQWDQYYEVAGDMHSEWDRIRIGKEVKFLAIGPEALRASMKRDAKVRADMEYRVLPGLKENLVDMVIYDDWIDYEIYGEPHLMFSIKNQKVAEGQKDYFEALWKLGTE